MTMHSTSKRGQAAQANAAAFRRKWAAKEASYQDSKRRQRENEAERKHQSDIQYAKDKRNFWRTVIVISLIGLGLYFV